METPIKEDYGFEKYASVINTLLEQDRIKYREAKNKVFNISSWIIFMYIGSLLFIHQISDGNVTDLKYIWSWIIMVGSTLILGFYLWIYFTYKAYLSSIRECLDLRELYIKDFNKFKELGLNPLSPAKNLPEIGFIEKEPKIYLTAVVIIYIFIMVINYYILFKV